MTLGHKSILLIVTLIIGGVDTGYAQEFCDGQECCDQARCWPRLKFWDDLQRIGKPCPRRDPYEERIETERHDFTQSTKTVGRGVVQVESGYSYFYKDTPDEVEGSHTTPEMQIRFGLSDDIEFRLRYSYAWTFIEDAETEKGSQDLIWSFKLGMTDECGCVPESALELRFTAPTGGSEFSTGRVENGLDYIYAWELAEGWELYGSTGYGTNGLGDFGLIPEEQADEWFVAWSQSVALGTELTEKMTVYNEVFGLFSHGLEDEFSIVIYNIGIDYYINHNFVVDFRAGTGLTPDSDDFFTGIGGGYRF